MFDALSEMPALSLVLKFLTASTLLMGSVWLLEKLGALKAPDLAELAWKLAVAGSFVALLPVGDWLNNPVTINHAPTRELVDEFNEGRPLAGMLPTLETVGGKREPASLTAPTSEGDLTLTAPTTDTPMEFGPGPVTDSETIMAEEKTITLWDILADLRTKDLAALMWAVPAAIALMLLMTAYVAAVKGLGSRKRVDAEDQANQTLRSICVAVDIKHVPYLSRSSDIKSPVCLPRREICLPDWAFDDLPEEELKSLLAHEVGHMVRRDPLMLMVMQFLSRLFFIQPLFMVARKRLTDLAELAADEWAATKTQDARSVAAALYTCATKIHNNRNIQWGLAMAGNNSMLKTRVERLVTSDKIPFRKAGIGAKSTMAAGLLAISLGLPSIQFADALSVAMPEEGENWVFMPEDEIDAKIAEMAKEYEPEVLVSRIKVAQLAKLKEQLRSVGPVPELDFAERLETVTTLEEAREMLTEVSVHHAEILSKRDIRTLERSLAEAEVVIAQAAAEAERAAELARAELEVAAETMRSVNVTRHDGTDRESGNMVWSDKGRTLRVNWDGRFRLNEDDTQVEWISKGGDLEISTKGEGPRRRIRFDENDGEIEITYWVDRDRTNFGQADKKWLEDALLMLVREMGLNADERVARFLKKGGPDAVIKEMGQIESDYVTRIYSRHLTDQADLTSKQIGKLVDRLAKIDSDYEMRLALLTLLEEKQMGDKVMPKVLKAAGSIDSDYEMRLLLAPYIQRFGLDARLVDDLLDLAATLESDYELRLLLTASLHDQEMSKKNIEKFVQLAADKIESDYELRLLLSAFADQYGKSRKATTVVLDAIARIESDYEKRLALGMIVHEGAFEKKDWFKVIETAAAIEGDYEKRLALTVIISKMPKGEDIRQAFDKAVATIESDYERELLTGAREGKVATPAVAPKPKAAERVTANASARATAKATATARVSRAARAEVAPRPERTIRLVGYGERLQRYEGGIDAIEQKNCGRNCVLNHPAFKGLERYDLLSMVGRMVDAGVKVRGVDVPNYHVAITSLKLDHPLAAINHTIASSANNGTGLSNVSGMSNRGVATATLTIMDANGELIRTLEIDTINPVSDYRVAGLNFRGYHGSDLTRLAARLSDEIAYNLAVQAGWDARTKRVASN